MRRLLVYIFCFLPFSSYGLNIKKCGKYRFEGQLAIEEYKKIPYLKVKLNPGAKSEINVYIGKYEDRFKSYLNKFIKGSVEINKQCFYKCQGAHLSVDGLLEADRRPKNFLSPRPTPLVEKKCLD